MSSSSEQSPKFYKPLRQEKGTDQRGSDSTPSNQEAIDPVTPLSRNDFAHNPAVAAPRLNSPPSRPGADSTSIFEQEYVEIEQQQPIPPPSEPMQYRAIGLVKGRYTPSATQLNRGMLLTTDDTSLDAVLLGRVISLVKNHLDLEQEHLWVVYPRTREDQRSLHLQILGVWEPEELSKDQPSPVTNAGPTGHYRTPVALTDGYFSIRGEVIYQSQDQSYVTVKIQQSPRKQSEQPKSFKLRLEGILPPRAVGRFWDLEVERRASVLVINKGSSVAVVPPKKAKRPSQSEGHSTNSRQRDFPKPVYSKDTKLPTSADRVRREPVERPIKPNLRRADS